MGKIQVKKFDGGPIRENPKRYSQKFWYPTKLPATPRFSIQEALVLGPVHQL